jgi:hypothetical protein
MCKLTILLLNVASSLPVSIKMSTIVRQTITLDSVKSCLNENANGLRLFHPAYPLALLDPITVDQAAKIMRVKELTNSVDFDIDSIRENPAFDFLPWRIFPDLGIPETDGVIPSKSKINETYEKFQHQGHFVCAHKTEVPHKGCLLLNHWQQKVVYVSEYDIDRGAKGYELNQQSKHDAKDVIQWPPLALEIEITEGQWQPVTASDSIVFDLLDMLPSKMEKALWELVFLLLISSETEPDTMEVLFDTGMSPQMGLIAYLRLLKKVMGRAELNENVPEYRQIVEKEIII